VITLESDIDDKLSNVRTRTNKVSNYFLLDRLDFKKNKKTNTIDQ